MGRIELPSTIYETAALPLSYIGRAGNGNRTRILTLGRLHSTTKPYPHYDLILPYFNRFENAERRCLDRLAVRQYECSGVNLTFSQA